MCSMGKLFAAAVGNNKLETPSLGGIYAGDPNRLSASLIFGQAALPDHLRTNRPAKGKLNGTVAPPRGMQQLTDGLHEWLERSGVEFVFNQDVMAENNTNEPTVICLAANAAAEYLSDISPDISQCSRDI